MLKIFMYKVWISQYGVKAVRRFADLAAFCRREQDGRKRTCLHIPHLTSRACASVALVPFL